MTHVGTGKYTYEHIPDFLNLPPGESFGLISRLATDSQDRVFVMQRKDPPVLIFDRDGTYLDSWGTGLFDEPHGMKIVNDIVYTTDRTGHVAMIFTLDGRPLLVIGKRGVPSDTGCSGKSPFIVLRAAGPFNLPTEMMPGSSGDLYVTDGYGNCRVHRFTSDGRLIHSWGKPGKTAPGEFHLVHCLVIDPDGKLYVCDRTNKRVQIFSPEGEFIGMWTGMGRPDDITRDKDGVFYIDEMEDDAEPPYISVRDGAGKVLSRWPIKHAHGITVDSQGSIYAGISIKSRAHEPRYVDKYVRKG